MIVMSLGAARENVVLILNSSGLFYLAHCLLYFLPYGVHALNESGVLPPGEPQGGLTEKKSPVLSGLTPYLL